MSKYGIILLYWKDCYFGGIGMKMVLLLIILTIGLVGCSPAVDLYEEAQDIVSNEEVLNELDQLEKEMLNAQIEIFEGNIRGAELKSLIRKINMLNADEVFPTKLIINDDSNSNITLVDGEYLEDGVKKTNDYEVSLEYGENGVITAININIGSLDSQEELTKVEDQNL